MNFFETVRPIVCANQNQIAEDSLYKMQPIIDELKKNVFPLFEPV
jgi:hypothetical protein